MQMRIYGYCRVSTQKQNIQRQIDNIKTRYPLAEVITEEYTGTSMNRPEWNKLYKTVLRESAGGEDVTIVFDEVSRMSRDAEEGFRLYQELYDRGIRLVFLKEPYIDTDTYRSATEQNAVSMTGTDVDIILDAINRYQMRLAEAQIKLAFEAAQKEVDYLHQRTSEGVRRAQRDGRRVGTQRGDRLTVKKAEPIKQLILRTIQKHPEGLTDKEVMALLAVETVEITLPGGRKKLVSARLSRNTYYKYKAELKGEGLLAM